SPVESARFLAQPSAPYRPGLLRRCAPRKDENGAEERPRSSPYLVIASRRRRRGNPGMQAGRSETARRMGRRAVLTPPAAAGWFNEKRTKSTACAGSHAGRASLDSVLAKLNPRDSCRALPPWIASSLRSSQRRKKG